MINIVLICDKKYLIPTKVVINSIIKNKKKEDSICVYVIGIGLVYSDFDSIMQLCDQQVHIKPVMPGAFFEQISVEHIYVSKAALYKFLIPKLINVDKVLYLDSDVLVLNSLRSLYETDLGNMYAAVVKDIVAEHHFHFHLKHNIPCYFNSGMMLLNLRELRAQQVVQKLITVRQNDTSNVFMDQDTFNKVFVDKVILLSPEYNYMQTNDIYTLDEIAEYYDLTTEEIRRIVEHPVILHLTYKDKPWNNCEARNQRIWYQYAFTEDFPQIIQDVVNPWKIRIADQKFMLAQQEENIAFYKNNKKFQLDDVHIFGITEKVWKIREKIFEYLKKWDTDMEYKVIIYGAGKMGQAVFKCLWSLNYSEQVVGFAVGDKENNVDELYGKKVLDLGKYENPNMIIIVAVKNLPGDEIRQKMQGRKYKDILEISKMLS